MPLPVVNMTWYGPPTREQGSMVLTGINCITLLPSKPRQDLITCWLRCCAVVRVRLCPTMMS